MTGFVETKLSCKKVFCEIFSSRLFWFGLFLKLILSAIFASKFLADLFLPFVNFYVSSSFANPYEYFNQTNPEAFPYPVLMLWLVTLPYYLLQFFVNISPKLAPFLNIAALRISILAADFAILVILMRWLRFNSQKLIIFYWLSPVLIYINYLHGQLDCIPIAVLFFSIYLLFKDKIIFASLTLAAAVACKTNIILAVPFFFVCLFAKKVSCRKLALCAAVFALSFVLWNLPYLFSPGFQQMVFFNNTQSQIFDVFYSYNSEKLFYIIPGVYLMLLAKALMIPGYNRDIFIMFLGFSFGVLNLFIPPMQGWYYWVLPFFCYFYIKQKNAPDFLFFALQAFYLLYFVLIKNSDYLEIFQIIAPQISELPNLYQITQQAGFDADKLANISFTFLQVTLLLNCFWIYRRGISSYLKHKLISRPYLIGISGDSGVGKTTLVSLLLEVFGKKNVTTICGDDMHKWERGHEKWRELTHLNPSANKLYQEASFLRALKSGNQISRKIYDHQNGKFTVPKIIEAKKIIILEGLHSFYVEPIRKLFDVKIFIKPQKELAMHWKIIRDQIKRGYAKDQVLEQMKLRQEDSQKFILSQEKFADVKIEISTLQPIKNLGDKNEKISLELKFSFGNNVDIEPFFEVFSAVDTIKINHGFEENDKQFLKISGTVRESEIKTVSDILLRQAFEEIDIKEPKWASDLDGLTQIFLAYYIIQSELTDEEKNS